ncbi:hypothetical protein ACFSCX_05905 [Bacillus salitolerans]|uniref:Uncharacterized protein n=1 Tax=Bacillus salitolerans TaxID=1437434 RepID=A0ABW4LLP0_9BACI
MEAFKNRMVTNGMQVDCYRNLHHGGFSIREAKSGKVLAHADQVTLSDCRFIVQQTGRRKTVEEQKKRVHAFVRGKFVHADQPRTEEMSRVIYYNPYTNEHFIDAETKEIVEHAPIVHFEGKVCYSTPGKQSTLF